MSNRTLFYKTTANDRGFTIIEVIAVLIIIGILGAFAVSRSTSATTYTLASEAEILKGHLRYAQYRAMSDSVSWGMSFSGGGYSLLKNKLATTSTLPNESTSSHTLAAGITITTGAGSAIHFNDWGNPTSAADVLLAADTLIVLSDGTATQTIRVTQNTGFVP